MKKMHFHKLILSLFLFVIFLQVYSQKNPLNYTFELNTGISTKSTLPFWMSANKFGAVPTSNHISLYSSIFSGFKQSNSIVDFSYKASFTGYAANKNHLLINELYGSLRYKKWLLDIGIKHGQVLWEGLSSSNGNIVMSTNARSFPGYNLQLVHYIKLPFAKKWLAVKGNYADYLLNDKRVVENARLHHKSIYFRSTLNAKVELIMGINHYVQWGGTSYVRGKLPAGFSNYIKVVTGQSGGSDALQTEKNNALGNHIGSYLLQLNYSGTKLNWSFYYSHLFEDRSGRELTNWRDGLYGIFIDFKKPTSLLTHFLGEFTYTKHMSGSTGFSGRDNYFNNSIYGSGWTYFGNTIGSPYFTPKPIDEAGRTHGVIVGDNRFIAYNIGMQGYFLKLHYKALFSHTTYIGWFGNEYENKPTQFSGIVTLTIPKSINFPIAVSVGIAFDTGTYRPVTFGGFLKLSKSGGF